jgi:hypothetical protein
LSNLFPVGSEPVEVCSEQVFDNLNKHHRSVKWAGVVYRLCPGPPTQRRDFDYLRPLQGFCGCGLLVGHRIASPINGVRFSALAPFHAGVAQVEEHRTRNAEAGVSNTPSGSSRCSSTGEQLHGRQPMSVRFAPLAPESQAP